MLRPFPLFGRPLLLCGAATLLLGAQPMARAETEIISSEWETTEGAWGEDGNWSAGKPGKTSSAQISNGGTAILDRPAGSVARFSVSNDSTLRIEHSGRFSFINTSSLGTGGTLSLAGQLSSYSAAFMMGSGTFHITEGGSARLTFAIPKGNISGLRLGTKDSRPLLLVDGGALHISGALRIGGADSVEARLVVKNSGWIAAHKSASLNLSGGGGWAFKNCTSELIIGGEEEAEAPGTFEGIDLIEGHQDAHTSNRNVVTFRHNAARYHLRQTAADEPMRLSGHLDVRLESGTTVLEGPSDYTGATFVASGAVLIANSQASSDDPFSSTGGGHGSVTIESGGRLSGIGSVRGDVKVAGVLKPGDTNDEADQPRFHRLSLHHQATLQPEGTLHISVNGREESAISSLSVSGALALDGTLIVSLHDGFDLAPGENVTLQLYSAQEITGRFAKVELPQSWKGRSLQWSQLGLSQGKITVSALAHGGVAP